MLEEFGHLGHLHHEGGLAPRQVVRGPDAGENPVHHPDVGRPGGDEGAHLGHEDHKGHLAHVGGFARHVGPGEDGRPVVLAVHVGVVGDEEAVLQHLLHHRVAALGDLQFVRVVHQGHAVVVLRRHQGEGRQHVGLGHGPGDLLDLGHLGGGLVPDLTEELVPRATIRSWAERMVCSMSLSSWVMYRSQLTRVCFRMYSGEPGRSRTWRPRCSSQRLY